MRKCFVSFKQLSGVSIYFYYDKFASEGVLVEEIKNLAAVKVRFFDNFVGKEDPQDTILQALKGVLDISDIPRSLEKIERIYE